VPGAWTVMSCTLAAGGSLQWFRNQFCAAEMQAAAGMGTDPYYLMDKQAERVPIGANRLLFLPYLMGERSPLLDPDARGAFLGLSGMHTRQDMLRAVREGVAFSLRECLDVLREMGVPLKEMLATGGGGTSPLWRQMLADLYDCPVVTIDNKEGAALGAAILAGVGASVFPNVQEACKNIVNTNAPQQPVAANTAAYEPYYALYKDAYRSLKAQFTALAAL
jgi:xylulokinase